MPAMQRTIVSLSAGQAAGTASVLAANPNRKVLYIGNIQAVDARVDVSDASGGYGMPLPQKSTVMFGGDNPQWSICPTDAIFVGGLSAADKLTIWEA